MSTGLLIITLTVSSIFYWKAETAVIQLFSVLLLIGIIRIFFMKRNCRMTRFKTQMRIFFMIKRMVLKSRLFISQSALRTCCFSSLLFALLSCAQ